MIDRNGIPEPQFEMWQPVRCVYVDEFGSEWVDRGIVTGILYKFPDLPHSIWTYQVAWYDISQATWLSVPYVDTIAEAEISADLTTPVPLTALC